MLNLTEHDKYTNEEPISMWNKLFTQNFVPAELLLFCV